MFKDIVVGLDGSETSEKALRIACDLGKKYGSAIHLVYTAHPETVAIPVGAVAGFHAATTMPSAAEVKAAGEKVLASGVAIAKECGQKITKTHFEHGKPADQILACADGCGADLIVTGRRGLGAISSLLLGSTSQQVSHLAKCACLTVA
jgi:nucleotide-binding universal stress UspA family protein